MNLPKVRFEDVLKIYDESWESRIDQELNNTHPKFREQKLLELVRMYHGDPFRLYVIKAMEMEAMAQVKPIFLKVSD